MPSTITITQVPAAQHRLVARVFARAFADDPVNRWMMRSDDRFEPGFDFYARRIWLPHGAAWATGDGRAVACWLPPGKAHMSLLEQLRLLPAMAAVAGRDLPRLLAGTSAMEKNHPHDPHWYLNMVGVEPAGQGRGLGSALIAHTLDRADAEGMPAYLDATTYRSVGLYERHGFEVTEEFRLPKGGPPLWRMWRDPQPR